MTMITEDEGEPRRTWRLGYTAVAWVFALLLMVVGGCGLFYPLFAGGPYKGRVIDAETKEPLEGAVVLTVWHSMTPALVDVMYLFLDAEEVLTDKDGRFVVGKHPPVTWIPIAWVDAPRITIFYPGYGFYPRYHVSPPWPPGGTDALLEIMEKGELTVELPRLKTREERLKVMRGVLPMTVPWEKMPIFLRLVNEERRVIGSTPAYTQ